ncbi:hypothetical protein FQN60_002776 [Etheostoma spectabile]|uniref:SUN domain-containing protein n=2 Tax=Etheostoma spectabile TaxID=54343 RepID=A0A5J5CJZ7_9PERO|nr:hypothetical protein FQN60_002776 [Etheostoma spectabile]
MRTATEEGTYLGTLVYDQDGAAFQTFRLPNPDKGVFRYVKLQIDTKLGKRRLHLFVQLQGSR